MSLISPNDSGVLPNTINFHAFIRRSDHPGIAGSALRDDQATVAAVEAVEPYRASPLWEHVAGLVPTAIVVAEGEPVSGTVFALKDGNVTALPGGRLWAAAAGDGGEGRGGGGGGDEDGTATHLGGLIVEIQDLKVSFI
ncbi:hypothetical protein V2A60_007261 [Cordyceps javanica]